MAIAFSARARGALVLVLTAPLAALHAESVYAADAQPPMQAEVLDRIDVVARLPENPKRRAEAVSRIDEKSVQRIAPTHANEVFVRIPGAWASRGSGQEQLLALRSPVLTGPGACGAFLVLDDGVPIRPAGFCNVNQLSEVNLSQAAGVEVLRGTGSAVHGSNALHGVVAVRPRLPGDGSGIRAEWGSNVYRRLAVGLDGRSTDLRFDANAVDAGSFRVDEAYRQQQALLQWLPFGSSDTRLALSSHRLRQDTAGFVFGEGAWRDARRSSNQNPEAFREAQSTRVVLHHVRNVGDEGTLLLRPYARRESQTFLQHFNLGQPLEENGSQSAGLQSLWSTGLLRVGIDVEQANGRLQQTQARALTTGTAAQNGTRPQGRHYDYRVRAQQAALFAETQWDWGTQTFTAGARIEQLRYRYDNRMASGNTREDGSACSFGGCLYLRPADRNDRFIGRSAQLGWVRSLEGGWQMSARVARAFRFPQATELYRLQRGQTVSDFAPETLDSMEAGLRFSGVAVSASATAYAMRKRNAILRDANGLAVPQAATRHRGAEFEARWVLPKQRWLEGQAAYSIQRYAFDRVLPAGEVVRNGAEIDTAPRWLAGLRAGQGFGNGAEIELESVRQGSYFIDAANTQRYDGHVLWHLRGTLPVSDDWRLGLRLMNLTNRRYAERVDLAFGEVRSFPGAGRSVFFSVERSL
jgi:outer membrane receptor protein involved in Fe transport